MEHNKKAGKERRSQVRRPSSASVLAANCQRRSESLRIAQQICFTNQHSFRQPLVVRTSFAVWLLLTAALCCVHAQDQEKKLVDRLLKPDMTLQNDAQNKKFSGDGSASINKRANVGTFFVHQKPSSKNYSGTRDFSTTQFYSQTYRGGRTASRGFVTANTCKFQGYLRKSDRPRCS